MNTVCSYCGYLEPAHEERCIKKYSATDQLQSRHLEAIRNAGAYVADEMASACTLITIEEMKGFHEWMHNERYSKYWGSDGPNCNKWYKQYTLPDREYYTYDELINFYLNRKQ